MVLMPVFTSMTVFEVVKGQMGMVSDLLRGGLMIVLLPHQQLCHCLGLTHSNQQVLE
jgi:hypothetical protein